MDFIYNGEEFIDNMCSLEDVTDNGDIDSSFEGDDFIDNFDNLSPSNISFGASSEKTLEYDLRQAQKNIDYFEREIRNFNDFTTETYKKNCLSHLEQAVKKANDITEKLKELQSK